MAKLYHNAIKIKTKNTPEGVLYFLCFAVDIYNGYITRSCVAVGAEKFKLIIQSVSGVDVRGNNWPSEHTANSITDFPQLKSDCNPL